MLKRIIAKTFGSLSVKQQQITRAVFLGLLVTGIISFIVHKAINNPTFQQTQQAQVAHNDYAQNIESAGQKVDPQEIWRYKVQEQQQGINKDIEDIKQTLGNVLAKKEQNVSPSQVEVSEVTELREEVRMLQDLVQNMMTQKANMPIANDGLNAGQNGNLGIGKIKINLKARAQNAERKSIEDTIPAGAFAKGALLGGVDAATSIDAQGDPRPLLIRLTEFGTLPRKFRSDLKDCHIVASGYGDLSSERVFARLEKLTCVDRTSGDIVETGVAGYVAGEDGRAGIRGLVIEKGRGYIEKSITGGIIQGVAGILNPANGIVLNPSMGALLPKRNMGEKFGGGMAAGISSSMDKLSEYYIKRAESIQPVIQVTSGRVVDVVFTEGAAIGSHRVKKELAKKRANEYEHEYEENNDN